MKKETTFCDVCERIIKDGVASSNGNFSLNSNPSPGIDVAAIETNYWCHVCTDCKDQLISAFNEVKTRRKI